MATVPTNSQIIFNAREEILTSDLQQAQQLAGRDAVNEGAYTANYRNHAQYLLHGGQMSTSLAVMDITVGAGEARYTPATSTTDDPVMGVVRWPTQVVTPGAGGLQPRIDLLVATPAIVDGDSASRNVLIDPVTRTAAALTVNKTRAPLATLSIVAGTIGAAPTPPSVPAGAVPLAEIYVPAAATASGSTTITPRLWPAEQGASRAGYFAIGTSLYTSAGAHGVIRGCQLSWSNVNESGGFPSVPTLSTGVVAINGVVMPVNTITVAFDDDIAPPVAAPASEDRPFYIYLVGGPGAPQGARAGTVSSNSVAMVFSLTAPTALGFASSALSLASYGRGAIPTTSTLYIGVGYKVANTLNNKQVCYDGDWVYASILPFAYGTATPGAPGAGTFDYATRKPSVSTRALFLVGWTSAVLGNNLTIYPVGAGSVMYTLLIRAVDAGLQRTTLPYTFPTGTTTIAYTVSAAGTVEIQAIGYNMLLPKLG